jgi:Protein of unknown function (DUF2946)
MAIHSLRPGLAAFVLAVYVSAVVGGGLHHHDHYETSAREQSRLTETTIEASSQVASTHEDEAACTLCNALHQAKALSELVSSAEAFLLVGQATIFLHAMPPAPLALAKQARAPPAL